MKRDDNDAQVEGSSGGDEWREALKTASTPDLDRMAYEVLERMAEVLAKERAERVRAGSDTAALEFVDDLVAYARSTVPGSYGPGYFLITYARRQLRDKGARDVFDLIAARLSSAERKLLDELMRLGEGSDSWDTVKNVGSRHARKFRDEIRKNSEKRRRYERWLLVLVPPILFISAVGSAAAAATRAGKWLGRHWKGALLIGVVAATAVAVSVPVLSTRSRQPGSSAEAERRSMHEDVFAGAPRTAIADAAAAATTADSRCAALNDVPLQKRCYLDAGRELRATDYPAAVAAFESAVRISYEPQFDSTEYTLAALLELVSLHGVHGAWERAADAFRRYLDAKTPPFEPNDCSMLALLERRSGDVTVGRSALDDCYKSEGPPRSRPPRTRTSLPWIPCELEAGRVLQDTGVQPAALATYLSFPANVYRMGTREAARQVSEWKNGAWSGFVSTNDPGNEALSRSNDVATAMAAKGKLVWLDDVAVVMFSDETIGLIPPFLWGDKDSCHPLAEPLTWKLDVTVNGKSGYALWRPADIPIIDTGRRSPKVFEVDLSVVFSDDAACNGEFARFRFCVTDDLKLSADVHECGL